MYLSAISVSVAFGGLRSNLKKGNAFVCEEEGHRIFALIGISTYLRFLTALEVE